MAERRTPQTFTCKGCQAVVTKLPSPKKDIRKDYCSRACKMRVWWQTHEKKVYAPTSRFLERQSLKRAASLKQKAERKAESQRRELNRRMAVSSATSIRTCRACGATFIRPLFRPGTWAICPECKPAVAQACRRRQRQVHGKKPAERARRRGLPYERCGPIAVCTRDGWHCRLCGVSTPRRLRGTNHACAPEVDHIVPLSHPNSPGHVWSNVQCLCRSCNSKKGTRIQGQLRLAM